MGMILSLATLSDESLARVLEEPERVWQIAAPDFYQSIFDELALEKPPGLIGRLLGRKPRPGKRIEPLVLEDGEAEQVDLDKSWHAIHYLLTDTADERELPQGFLLSGGAVVGDVDLGYGPARAFSSAETKAIADVVDELTEDEVARRYDGEAMDGEDVYPRIWSRPLEEDDVMGYLLEYVGVLRAFVEKAQARGLGLLVWLS